MYLTAAITCLYVCSYTYVYVQSNGGFDKHQYICVSRRSPAFRRSNASNGQTLPLYHWKACRMSGMRKCHSFNLNVNCLPIERHALSLRVHCLFVCNRNWVIVCLTRRRDDWVIGLLGMISSILFDCSGRWVEPHKDNYLFKTMTIIFHNN